MTDFIQIGAYSVVVFILGAFFGVWLYYQGSKKKSPFPEKLMKTLLRKGDEPHQDVCGEDAKAERERPRRVRA